MYMIEELSTSTLQITTWRRLFWRRVSTNVSSDKQQQRHSWQHCEVASRWWSRVDRTRSKQSTFTQSEHLFRSRLRATPLSCITPSLKYWSRLQVDAVRRTQHCRFNDSNARKPIISNREEKSELRRSIEVTKKSEKNEQEPMTHKNSKKPYKWKNVHDLETSGKNCYGPMALILSKMLKNLHECNATWQCGSIKWNPCIIFTNMEISSSQLHVLISYCETRCNFFRKFLHKTIDTNFSRDSVFKGKAIIAQQV